MLDVASVLGKFIIALLLSLLLNYVYIAIVSRLKKPSDKAMIANLHIRWQGERNRKKYNSRELAQKAKEYEGKSKEYEEQTEKSKDRKRGKAGGKRKRSRADRKRQNI